MTGNYSNPITLRPYKGPHAGNLHHVVGSDGQVIRNATSLEVDYWLRIKALESKLYGVSNEH